MARTFDPESMLRALAEHEVNYVLIGGLAATLYGSPFVTTDANVVPAQNSQNLDRLAQALINLEARVRVAEDPAGVPFNVSASLLATMERLNLVTRCGNLDVTFVPTGTQGYEDLRKGASELTIRGIPVTIASLADIIRSKAAADREKDRLVLPTLRRLLERIDGQSE